MNNSRQIDCDLLVVGAGAGGLSTAITAKKHGLDVVVVEKEPYFGGTTAFSGGVLWIPGNPHAKHNGVKDTRESARAYLKNETGRFFDESAVDAFLDNAPRMVEFFERETQVRFVPTQYPDYHPDAVGGVDVGRSILAAPYDIRALGADMARLRPPLRTITFIGMMFQVSIGYPQAAAWMPVSKVPLGKGRIGVFPHLLDRYKPGVIGVTQRGALLQRVEFVPRRRRRDDQRLRRRARDRDVAGLRPRDHPQVRPGLRKARADADWVPGSQRLPQQGPNAVGAGAQRRHRRSCARNDGARLQRRRHSR